MNSNEHVAYDASTHTEQFQYLERSLFEYKLPVPKLACLVAAAVPNSERGEANLLIVRVWLHLTNPTAPLRTSTRFYAESG
jgi:hypothetical protein